jgi:tripartite-type tricarboxylate transporter receptor subunit TctC
MRALLAVLFACAAGLAAAQPDYPSRAVRMIVPFAPGGSTDALARIVAVGLADALGQPVAVENRAGAGGNIGVGIAAKSPPDGHTLLIVASGFVVNPGMYAQVPYDPVRDFAPISYLANVPSLLVAHPSTPAATVKELVAMSKANPGKLNYASAGYGSHQHLVGELFRLITGADVTHVPFNGGNPAMLAVLGGQVQVGITALPTALSNLAAGKLRALAVTSEARASALPEVPTFAEAGFAGLDSDQLIGLLAPAGTPRPVVSRLYAESVKVIGTPEARKKLGDLGFVIVGSTPEEFARQIQLQAAKWGKVVREAGIKAE